MQLINDIVAYLRERGLLGSDDLRYLREHGFLKDDAALPSGAARSSAVELAQLEPGNDAEPDELADELGRWRGRNRRKGGRRQPRNELASGTISSRILAAWTGWQVEIASLKSFAELIAPARDLDTALQTVRQAKAHTVDGAIVCVLDGKGPSLDDLWRALSFDNYVRGIVPADGRGSAVKAYRAIIGGTPHGQLGRYAHTLRHAGFARLLLLVQSQRSILAAFGRCLAARPQLFDRRLFGYRCNETCYWSLTVVVSALLATADGPPPFRLEEPWR